MRFDELSILGHFERKFHDPREIRSAYHVRKFEIFKLTQVNDLRSKLNHHDLSMVIDDEYR
jgi:hypothetical protein